jgi:hypothetical protein
MPRWSSCRSLSSASPARWRVPPSPSTSSASRPTSETSSRPTSSAPSPRATWPSSSSTCPASPSTSAAATAAPSPSTARPPPTRPSPSRESTCRPGQQQHQPRRRGRLLQSQQHLAYRGFPFTHPGLPGFGARRLRQSGPAQLLRTGPPGTFNGSVYFMMRDDRRDLGKVPPCIATPCASSIRASTSAGSCPSTSASASPSPPAPPPSSPARTAPRWSGAASAPPTNGAAFPHTTPDRPYLSAFTLQDSPQGIRPRLPRRSPSTSASPPATASPSRISIPRSTAGPPPAPSSSIPTRSSPAASPPPSPRRRRRRHPGAHQRQQPRPRKPHLHAHAHLAARRPALENRFRRRPRLRQTPYRDTDKGSFLSSPAPHRRNVTIGFADTGYLRPGTITVIDNATRHPRRSVPARQLRAQHGGLQSAARSDVNFTATGQRPPRLSLARARHPPHRPRFRQTTRDSSTPGPPPTPTATPPSTAAPLPFLDPALLHATAPYGFPRIQYPDYKAVFAYLANPAEFTLDENASTAPTSPTPSTCAEGSSAAYLRGDVALLNAACSSSAASAPSRPTSRPRARSPIPPATSSATPAAGPSSTPPAAVIPITTNALETSKLTLLAARGPRGEGIPPPLPLAQRQLPPPRKPSPPRRRIHEIGPARLQPVRRRPHPAQHRQPPRRQQPHRRQQRRHQALDCQHREGPPRVLLRGRRPALRRRVPPRIQKLLRRHRLSRHPEFLGLYGLDPGEYGPLRGLHPVQPPAWCAWRAWTSATARRSPFCPPGPADSRSSPTAACKRPTPRGASSAPLRLQRDSAQRRLGHQPDAPPLQRPPQLDLARRSGARRPRHRRRHRTRDLQLHPGFTKLDVLGRILCWKRFASSPTSATSATCPTRAPPSGPTPPHATLRFRERYGSLWTLGVKGTF